MIDIIYDTNFNAPFLSVAMIQPHSNNNFNYHHHHHHHNFNYYYQQQLQQRQLYPTWKPPAMPWLYYQTLYRGLPEYVRMKPTEMHRVAAIEYLDDLKPGRNWDFNPLQKDRITWTRVWIANLPHRYDEAEDSEADTVDLESA